MHHITTKKLPGVISGIQTTENGPIEWSRNLPEHCQLSTGLKQLVTPLLSGLLEENEKRMWSFDRFFNEVTNILNKKVIHIFYINRASSIEIFMEPNESNTLFHFKEHINLQTEVNPESQLLLYGEEHLEEKVGTNTSIRGYPKTTNMTPITLYSIENNNVCLQKDQDLPKFPTFPVGVSVENDASMAKVACSVGHECKRRIESCTKIDILINLGIESFIGLLKSTLDNLLIKSRHFEDIRSTAHELSDALEILVPTEIYHDENKQISIELKSLKDDFSRILEPIQQLNNRFCVEDILTREWKTSSRDIKGPSTNYSNEKAKHLVERLRDSWQHLLRDRATRSLTYNDEQFHALEKVCLNL